MKNSNSINLVYVKKVDINEIELLISLIVSEFRKQVNDFIIRNGIDNFRIKDIITYQMIYNLIIQTLLNFGIKGNQSNLLLFWDKLEYKSNYRLGN